MRIWLNTYNRVTSGGCHPCGLRSIPKPLFTVLLVDTEALTLHKLGSMLKLSLILNYDQVKGS